jgi:Effector-associated domain 1
MDWDMNEARILDSAVLPWDDDRVIQLRSVLVKAYNRPDGIEDLVARVEQSLVSRINWRDQSGVYFIWTNVMNATAGAGALRRLLNTVLADPVVAGHHKAIRGIIGELDVIDRSRLDEETIPAPAEHMSITDLATTLATELPQLAGELIEQTQALASCSDRLEIALAATAVTNTINRIRGALNSIDKIGLGKSAETAVDDRDKVLRKEIHRQLDLSAVLLSKVAARHDDTTSVTGLTAAVGRLHMSARDLAGLRERHHRSP